MEPVVHITQVYHEAVLPKQHGINNGAEPLGNYIYDEIREKESLGIKNNRVSVLLIITMTYIFYLYLKHT